MVTSGGKNQTGKNRQSELCQLIYSIQFPEMNAGDKMQS